MKSRLAVIAAVLAALALTAAAPQAALVRHYYTELYRFPQGGFPRSATLDLTIGSNGSLHGYYRPTDGGVRSVTGSFSGARISLEIGGVEGLQVTGTLSGGKIVGRATQFYGRQIFSFVGRPIPNDATLPRVSK